MSRLLTVLGVLVAMTAQVAPQLAQAHPRVAFWLTVAGLCGAAAGREIVKPSFFKPRHFFFRQRGLRVRKVTGRKQP